MGVSYLLDTNACIALMAGRLNPVRERFSQSVAAGHRIAVSSLAVFELWYGVARSERRESNARRLAVFLAGDLDVLPFDEEDAQFAGELRATLESAGTPIGAYDLLMAGQALGGGLTLVTAKTREFARIAGLDWQDWSVNSLPG